MKIKKLEIHTKNLESQLDFYSRVLGLPASTKSGTCFSVQTGYSELEFHQHENSNPYHIAFHIGKKQEAEALEWLKEKEISILTDEGKEVVDFPAWNAKSLYFYDAGHNIIEFISREHLFPHEDIFSGKNLFGIAEIGLATNDVEENFRFLDRYYNLEIYFGKPEEAFCAIGDDEGLLITVDKNQKTWFPTNDKALPADFDLKFEHKGKSFEVKYENGKLMGM